MIAAEALCCQRPVVCSEVGGLRALVRDGRTGLCVPPDDPAALAAAVRRCLEDAPMAERLACQGRLHVQANFSLAAMVERTATVYRELVFYHRSACRRAAATLSSLTTTVDTWIGV